MNRLTENRHYLKACTKCLVDGEGGCNVTSCRHLYATIIKLYDYEETGLTPNGVKALKAKYYELTQAVS